MLAIRSVSTRFVVAGVLTTFIVLCLAAVAMYLKVRPQVEHTSGAALYSRVELIAKLAEANDKAMRAHAERAFSQFAHMFSGHSIEIHRTDIEDVAGQHVPVLMHNAERLNGNATKVDSYTQASANVATVFARVGDDFLRVTTSLKKQDGSRAVGTFLGAKHPAHAHMLAGERYIGGATLFGRKYMTVYEPIKDPGGKPIGILFIGTDITDSIAALMSMLESERLGDEGFLYAIDASAGEQRGRLIFHPTDKGKPLADVTGDASLTERLLKEKRGIFVGAAASLQGERGHHHAIAYYDVPMLNAILVAEEPDEQFYSFLDTVMLGIGLITLAAACTLAATLWHLGRRQLARPIAALGTLINRLAEGDFSRPLTLDRHDEIGQLAERLEQLRVHLSRSLQQVRQASDTIAGATSEIANGNADLSSRTEHQASNLEQTSASMDELTGTVQQNAEHARHANALAQEASRVAQEAGDLVARIIDSMKTTGESAGKIGQIIGVIDGLAFQTNILALNAAVEAARAGEQGRGFAVVASEVRSLAQRSAQAAKEIRELITRTLSQVNESQTLVTQSGSTMNAVVESVGRVSGLITEIADASQQQSSGIGEVKSAIAQIDGMTQQNAALVEEAAAASASLREEAHKLADAVAAFKLDH